MGFVFLSDNRVKGLQFQTLARWKLGGWRADAITSSSLVKGKAADAGKYKLFVILAPGSGTLEKRSLNSQVASNDLPLE